MSVKRTKIVDPDLGDIKERVHIDFTAPSPGDAEAINEAMKAHHPVRKLVAVFRAFQKLPEDFPESEEFTAKFIRLVNDHKDGTRQVRHADSADCQRLLERARRRQDKRNTRTQQINAGTASSRRPKRIYDLIEGWILHDPGIKMETIWGRLEDGQSVGFGDVEVEIFSDGDRVYQRDHNGVKSVAIGTITKYSAEIRGKLKSSG